MPCLPAVIEKLVFYGKLKSTAETLGEKETLKTKVKEIGENRDN